jgi:hypothetical protein
VRASLQNLHQKYNASRPIRSDGEAHSV